MNRKSFTKSFAVLPLLAALAISGLSSCLSNRKPDNAHNSRDSLDWEGVYTGTIPAASGSGINVRMRLNKDQTFELNYEYLDKPENSFTFTGSFKWDDTGNIVILDIVDAPLYYKAAENALIQMDMEGKPISGGLAVNYVLKKEE